MHTPNHGISKTLSQVLGDMGHPMDMDLPEVRLLVTRAFESRPGARPKFTEQCRALAVAVAKSSVTDQADATGLCRALMRAGEPLSMSQIYRGLHVLADIGVISPVWLLDDGRPRRAFIFKNAALRQTQATPANANASSR